MTTNPVASWFERRARTNACTDANMPPATMPATAPTHGLPTSAVTAWP
jgi:hypothetical protein